MVPGLFLQQTSDFKFLLLLLLLLLLLSLLKLLLLLRLFQGHTLQGNYEGAFVYAKEPVLPEAAKPAIRDAAAKAGLDFDAFTRIDNTCPAGESLNDAEAGTGTSTTDWIDLVVGEGGVIDWISPGWRGEYKK